MPAQEDVSMDGNQSERSAGPFAAIRKRYPRAYKLWSQEDDLELVRLYELGMQVTDLSKRFQRQPGAIKSRLRKLETENGKIITTASAQDDSKLEVFQHILSERVVAASFRQFNIGFNFAWYPVLSNEVRPYRFPERQTAYMREMYNQPVVYRWAIYALGSDVLKAIYIGISKRLCPDRIEGYLNPKTSKTSQRLHLRLSTEIEMQSLIDLDILGLCFVEGNLLGENDFDLSQTSSRLFFENLLITYYRRTGVEVLNL